MPKAYEDIPGEHIANENEGPPPLPPLPAIRRPSWVFQANDDQFDVTIPREVMTDTFQYTYSCEDSVLIDFYVHVGTMMYRLWLDSPDRGLTVYMERIVTLIIAIACGLDSGESGSIELTHVYTDTSACPHKIHVKAQLIHTHRPLHGFMYGFM